MKIVGKLDVKEDYDYMGISVVDTRKCRGREYVSTVDLLDILRRLGGKKVEILIREV